MKKYKKHLSIWKTITASIVVTLSLLFVAGLNVDYAQAGTAEDFCNDTIPVTNSDTAAQNASCITSARAAETRCGNTNGVGNQAWQQCIDNYYSGLTGTSSGATGPGSNGGSSVETDCEPDNNAPISSENCMIVKYLVTGINFLTAIAGMAIVFSIMFAGYQYMTARDNAGAISAAKTRIIWAIVALLMLIFTYTGLNFLVPGGVL